MIRAALICAAALALTAAAAEPDTAAPVAGAPAAVTHGANRVAPKILDLRTAPLPVPHADDRVPCRNFQMYAAQVVRYFQLAEELPVGARTAAMWFPCEVRGNLHWEGKSYSFQINLGRTAILRRSDGRDRRFVCGHACDGLLLGNRAWDAASDFDVTHNP